MSRQYNFTGRESQRSETTGLRNISANLDFLLYLQVLLYDNFNLGLIDLADGLSTG